MQMILMDSNYRDVAAIILEKFVKNGTQTEREENNGDSIIHVIDIVGDFEIFSLYDMEMWGGVFKFEIRDNEPKDEDEREARGQLAMQIPQMASVLASRSGMLIYRKAIIRTTTIIERLVGGQCIGQKQETVTETEDWENVTKETWRRMQQDASWG